MKEKTGLVVTVFLLSCGSQGGVPGRTPSSVPGTCGQTVPCSGGKSYQTCCTTTSCTLKTSDGQQIGCTATDCTGAAMQIAGWCNGTPVQQPGSPTCSALTPCGNGKSYQQCCTSGTCSIHTSDGLDRGCDGADCSTAVKDAQAWCAASSPTTPPVDLGNAGPLGCAGYLTCQNSCPQDTQANFDACNATCKKNTKMASYSKYSNALSCGQLHCLGGLMDGGNAKCALSSDQTQLTELDGSAISSSKPCGTCLNNALQALFGGTCSPATGNPDCNPTECSAMYNACLSDP
jgi:hypothetical protein